MVRAFLQVRTSRYGDNQVEMSVHELLAFPRDDLLYPLDVLHGHLVASDWEYWRAGSSFFVQQGQFPFSDWAGRQSGYR